MTKKAGIIDKIAKRFFINLTWSENVFDKLSWSSSLLSWNLPYKAVCTLSFQIWASHFNWKAEGHCGDLHGFMLLNICKPLLLVVCFRYKFTQMSSKINKFIFQPAFHNKELNTVYIQIDFVKYNGYAAILCAWYDVQNKLAFYLG